MELLVIIIVLALRFDYINGFHDAANSIATIVSTKVLTPFQAVITDNIRYLDNLGPARFAKIWQVIF